MKAIILLLVFSVFAINSYAQPAWSRGIQNLPIPFEECKLRAQKALENEGYNIVNRGGDFFGAFKGKNTAIIACSSAPDGKTWANIFVASETNDSDIPGAERVRLQARMDIPSNASITNPPINNPGVIQGTWGTQGDSYRGKNGQRFTFNIPPGTVTGRLWGTDIYTDDSPIGNAAVHAGLITAQSGGTVTIEIREGQSGYKGSVQNGVTSSDYGGYPGSYILVGGTAGKPQQPAVKQGAWDLQANAYADKIGQRFTFYFPPNGTLSSRVWGTDIYTYDCSIAAAAVHAGLITPQSGGTVTIEIRPGQPSYKGSARNGVTSSDWGSFGGSFVFVR